MNQTATLFSHAVGESLSADDLMTAGERIWNLERLFNLREGFARKDDTLPPRLLEEPMPLGPAKGNIDWSWTTSFRIITGRGSGMNGECPRRGNWPSWDWLRKG